MVNPMVDDSMKFSRVKPDVFGDAHPKALLKRIQEDGDQLQVLANQHIVSVEQFDADTILQLFRLASKYESNPLRFNDPLKGKILISAFYEPSTRTRLSFESAWHRLGGDIMSITDRATTGIAKGESLADVGEMFNNYGDCVVLRESNEESVTEMTSTLRIPIINAGNGTREHPTQAMADLYTIFKWKPELLENNGTKIKIGVIGVPSFMRTVRSLLKLFALFPDIFAEVVLIHDSDESEIFTPGQREKLEAKGLNLTISRTLDDILPTLDVVYINAIAWVGDSYEEHGTKFKLDKDSALKDDAIILHPLARGDELSTDLDETPHNWYFSQARGAVFLRMALLTCMVERTERVLDVV